MAADTVTVNDVVYTCGASTATASDYVGPEGVTVTIPASVSCPGGTRTVTVVGASSFQNANLTGIVFSSGLERIAIGAFFWNNFGDVSIPSTVKVIESGVFALAGVTSLELSQGLTSIGHSAFLGDWFSEVTVPGSVTNLEPESLATYVIESVTMLGAVPTTSGDPFGNGDGALSSGVVVSVPYAYLEAYRAAGWEDFPSVIALEAFDAPAVKTPVKVPAETPSDTPATQSSADDAALSAEAGLTVSPAVAAPGTQVTVSGYGFPGDVDVTIADFRGESLATARTGTLGEFTASFALDEEAQSGLFRVVASVPSGGSLSISFLATATEVSAAPAPSPSPTPSPSPSATSAVPDQQGSSSGASVWIFLAGGFVLIGGGGAGAWWYLRSRRTEL